MTKPTVIQAVGQAFSQIRRYRLTIGLLFLVNLATSITITHLFRVVFQSHAGDSLIDELPGGLFNGHHLAELTQSEVSAFGLLTVVVVIAFALFGAAQLFLAGGVAAQVHLGKGDNPRIFWRACGYYFPRFIRLALWTAPLLALIPIAVVSLRGVLTLIYGEHFDDELGTAAIQLQAALIVALVLVLKQLFALARLQMVRKPTRTGLQSLVAAVVFCGKELPTIATCLLLFTLMYLLLGFTWIECRALLPEHGLLLVLIHQVWIVGKKTLDVALTHTECSLLEHHAPSPQVRPTGMPAIRRLY